VVDASSGEIVKAWVVLKDGVSATVDDLRAFARERMTAYKVPKQIEFRKELPRTTVGKLLRRELVREHREKTPA
jgi:long-chain acyl-CoA synthetase